MYLKMAAYGQTKKSRFIWVFGTSVRYVSSIRIWALFMRFFVLSLSISNGNTKPVPSPKDSFGAVKTIICQFMSDACLWLVLNVAAIIK